MLLHFNKSFKLRTWPPRNLFTLANTLHFALFKSQRRFLSYSYCYNCSKLGFTSMLLLLLFSSCTFSSTIFKFIWYLIFRPGNCICSYTLAYAKHYNSETYIELIDDRNANIMEKWFYTFVNIEACALAQCPPFVPINLFFCERFDAIFFPEVKSDNMLLLNKSG